MTPRDLELRIDADPTGVPAGATALFAPAHEYFVALARLVASETSALIPDEVFLHVYAYELLERAREAVRAGATLVVAPLWPACAFAAAGIEAHAAEELHALLPSPRRTSFVPRPDACVAAAAQRTLGALRFDVARYQRELARAAR